MFLDLIELGNSSWTVFLRGLPEGSGFQLYYRAHSPEARGRDFICPVSAETAERLERAPEVREPLLLMILARELWGLDQASRRDEQAAGI